MSQTRILLDESEIPTHWYNVVADMPSPPRSRPSPATAGSVASQVTSWQTVRRTRARSTLTGLQPQVL